MKATALLGLLLVGTAFAGTPEIPGIAIAGTDGVVALSRLLFKTSSDGVCLRLKVNTELIEDEAPITYHFVDGRKNSVGVIFPPTTPPPPRTASWKVTGFEMELCSCEDGKPMLPVKSPGRSSTPVFPLKIVPPAREEPGLILQYGGGR